MVTSGVSPFTTTVSSTVESGRLSCRSTSSPVVTRIGRVTVAKPGKDRVSVYSPGVTLRKRKAPAGPETVERASGSPASETSTPGRTLPEGSTTVP